jgi:two-component system LytT family sensor kinase
MNAQLQPHFLFNTLHTISAMMREDVAGAERMIARLSDLLRLMLANVGTHEVPLRTELEFAARYVEIQRVRHGERVELATTSPPDVAEALVPNMLLQPLVENAIHHGFDVRSHERLRIGVTVVHDGPLLRIVVADDGRGPGAGAVAEGVGLRNTRSRLRELYGDGATLAIGRRGNSGCAVDITLPFRDSTSPEVGHEFAAAIADTDGYRRRRSVGAEAVARSA